MGRPSKFKREDAIEIALHAIWEKGYESTSVNELSSQMSITRSSFYNSFNSREELLSEVLKQYNSSLPDYFLTKLGPTARIIPALKRVFNNLIDARLKDKEAKGCLVTNGLANNKSNSDVADIFYVITTARIARFTELLNTAVERREIKPTIDTKTAATTLISQLIGLDMLSKTIRNKTQLAKIVEQTFVSLGIVETENKQS